MSYLKRIRIALLFEYYQYIYRYIQEKSTSVGRVYENVVNMATFCQEFQELSP